MMQESVRAVRVRVHGEVQGVSFRWSCEQRARELDVVGWVRNAADGTVEASFEGPADAVEQMITWSREGPPHADVDRVDVEDAAPTGAGRFEIR